LVVETFLIHIKKETSDVDKRRIAGNVRNIGGRIEASLRNGTVLIATFDNRHVEHFRRHPLITLVGGVTFSGRKIRKTTIQNT
jgi:hypothetical protein